MREIVTLQLGHYSNYVGTHWWNIQESGFEYHSTPSEINHDVLFRGGITDKKEVTYTPRLLLVDLKGSLKSLPEHGELYEPPVLDPSKVKVNWNKTEQEKISSQELEYNDFQTDLHDPNKSATEVLNKNYDLESQVYTWSDFLYTQFHPRTLNVIKEYQHCNEHTPFDIFSVGANLWKESIGEDFAEKIRNYVEESDCLQGFQVLTDCTNAFAGFSSSCLEYIRDEYDRKSVLVVPSIPSYFPDDLPDVESGLSQKNQAVLNDSTRVLNLALAFENFSQYSSLFVPLCTSKDGWRKPGEKIEFHRTTYNHTLPYHSSAILASALDTLSLPYRLKSPSSSLFDFCSFFNQNGRTAAAASVCLPFSFNQDADFIDCLDSWVGPLSKSITPRCTIGTDRYLQHITIRGIPETRLKKRQPNKAGKQLDMAAYKYDSVKEMLEFYLSCTTYATANRVTAVGRGLSTKTPFPNLFDSYVGVNGDICPNKRSESTRVANVPVLAGIHSGSGVGEMLETLHTEARKLKISKFHQFLISKDEHEDCLDNLFALRENYEDKYYL